MKKYLIIAIALFSMAEIAKADTLTVNVPVLDSLVNKSFGALESFASKMQISAQQAFPYAVKYVGVTRAVNFYIALGCLGLGAVILISSLICGLGIKWNDTDVAWPAFTIIGATICVISIIALCIVWPNYIIFRNAPEAATVDYLIRNYGRFLR